VGFLTHVELTKGLKIIKGIPTILADKVFEDAGSRVYEEYENGEHGQTAEANLKVHYTDVTSVLYGADV